MDDLMDVFEEGDGAGPREPYDPMARLEKAKCDETDAAVDNLLSSMLCREEPVAHSDDSTPAKRARLDEEKDAGDAPVAEPRMFQNVTVHKIEETGCTHEVALPPGMDYEPLKPSTNQPAKHYPFQLDAFQKASIQCIENNQSVLVSAHTSAGKTVVALYAIAQALRDGQRVIYTSPIKALSNQKYRELEEEFGDVGLMTGDVTINSEASCLVMTTEILRSMLYRGSQMMREVGWVVFDEIHYMRDKERGVVWEETIILLPDSTHNVFLSATIPNASQFAQWICSLHSQPCHVVYTDYRPTPLQHFIFPAGGSGLYEVVNQAGVFREDKFAEAMAGLAVGDPKRGAQRGRKGGMKGESDSNVIKIIRTIKERDMIPCIIFSFSRKECEAYALSLRDMDFNTEEEKILVAEIFKNAIDLLSEEDQKLPQIGQVIPLLKRGIGIHHSGLLPILKETVEILFGEGLIKTLFATETFAMGLNMPARTVLFTSARKFDGKENRWVTSGEYIQMAGRAGRRGKDDRGLVILMIDQQMSGDDAKQIIKGNADPLNSQFRLTYNMVLNLLRVPGIEPNFMLERSFHQFQNQGTIPAKMENVAKIQREIDEIKIGEKDELELKGYYTLDKTIEHLKIANRKLTMQLKYIVPFFHAGRLFKIKTPTCDFGWGVFINFQKKTNPDDKSEVIYIIEVLLALDPTTNRDLTNYSTLKPAQNANEAEWSVVPMMVECVEAVSAIRLKLPKDMRDASARSQIARMMKEVDSRMNGEIPLLDPIKDMKITDDNVKVNMHKLEEAEARFKEHPLRHRPDFKELTAIYRAKEKLQTELAAAAKELSNATKCLQMDELKKRKAVLRRLQFADQGDNMTDKGRVACEISAADELLLTEMLHAGMFTTLNEAECAALLSLFIFEEKSSSAKMDEKMQGILKNVQEMARRIAKVSNECHQEVIEEEYVDSFKPGMMQVVTQWVEGKSFAEILKTSDIFEGSIIRCFRRLEEVMREMSTAAKSMHNEELQAKFDTARIKIKRDIVFAASLYL